VFSAIHKYMMWWRLVRYCKVTAYLCASQSADWDIKWIWVYLWG